jgi:hemerythrin-like domain-containing protein
MLINPSAPPDKPETAQMVVIHKVFRREFALLPTLVSAVPEGDTTRSGRISTHAGTLFAMLSEHHESEDQFLWPLLHRRAPLEQALIDTMEAQHEGVAGLLATVEGGMRTWAASADAASRDRLATDLTRLRDGLDEHLDLEEKEVLPVIHDVLTVPEWEAPQRHAEEVMLTGFRPRMMLAGMVLEDATPAEQTWFLGQLPPPARLVWHLVGTRMYGAYTRAIRGSAA